METDRLYLAPPCLANQPAMLEAIIESQAELSQFLDWVPFALTEQQSIEATQQAMVNFDNFENELRYSLLDKQSGKLVGMIGLLIRDKEVPYFEIGYWLRRSCVGLGYITEAVQALETYAFQDLKAQRVEIRTAGTNTKSQAVAERCGYQLEGTLRYARRLPSRELDHTLIYAKTRL
ncbi:GNAT family N-acetyltransferase [Vibrio rumoiensis]|uniref:GNAT family N-acetyltransferase n=1 Tax=Vibrio rumoiensis TaxID=76258 RepID=A0ABW7IZR0_9VIBR|nr:GNAT family N-acetyltransferase [Vibrio rumoiensis]